MPDTTTDLDALAAQVKILGGDLNRRFEQLSNDITQLNSRIDTLSTTRKVSLHVAAAMEHVPEISQNVQLLQGDWLAGATSGFNQDEFKSQWVFLVRGKMFVVLPNLSRIGAFRASVHISDAQPRGFTILRISLQREETNNGRKAEPVMTLAWSTQIPDTLDSASVEPGSFEAVVIGLMILPPGTPSSVFVPGAADLHADPILGKEFVDNDRFRYFVLAEFLTSDLATPPKLVPQGMVVLDSFQIDCIVA